ncbi:MAG: UPF0182 family protein [Clostridia bacterium]|nr:UPF0182 family protein [Clostridia bacterium]
MRKGYGVLRIVLVIVLAVALGWRAIAAFAAEQMWYADLGYLGVYWKRVEARAITGLAMFTIAYIFVFANLLVVRRSSKLMPKRLANLLSAVAGLAAIGASWGRWMEFHQFLNATPFGKADPIFGNDVSFYIFRMPLIKGTYASAAWLVILTTALVILIYLMSGSIFKLLRREPDAAQTSGGPFGQRPASGLAGHGRLVFSGISPQAKLHICVLAAIMFIMVAGGYRLAMFNLLYSTRGLVLGASYADVRGALPALRILEAVAIIAAILMVLAGIVKARPRILRVSTIALTLVVIGSLMIFRVFPGIIQRLVVSPNEMELERPYIEHNIDFTRAAFGLDDIREREFEVASELAPQDILAAGSTIRNVRVWDWEPLLSTYGQLQEMRLYYKFSDIDIDRYTIGGKTTQVMIAARELDAARLPKEAQTWMNLRLKYTHGYGVCASPVNDISQDGLPTFVLRDIPPVGEPELAVERPEIYFGEETRDWVIVNTRTQEFDYPMGDANAYAKYSADSGVRMGHLLKRALLATRFSDAKILLSRDIVPDSRILYTREIGERLRKIAPYLKFDHDPYIIIANGRLVWMVDAYTASNAYPYAERFAGDINYIRNSVKATVDAYTGKVDFYLVDPDDPIAVTYSKVFPGVFKPASEMPAEIRAHVRYPEDLFLMQSRMYAMYHMRDSAVFYNKEDYWGIPKELYEGSQREVAPYYVNMELPGDHNLGFVLFMPFTPARKDNMTAWLAVDCDMDDYGQMTIYKFTKQRVIFGPMQIEAQIDQDAEISKMLALWNQKGSSVIRGNLLVYPIGRGILYVEPLFLAAQASQLPQLKRVVVSDGTRLAIGQDLGSALSSMLGVSQADIGLGRGAKALTGTPATYAMPAHGAASADAGASLGAVQGAGGNSAGAKQDAQRALELFQEGQDSLKRGDWEGYGEIERQLKAVLESLAGGER